MPNKSFIKILLERRIPQIIGSYFIAGTSFIFFIQYLVDKYQFPSYYPTLSLFGIIGILPSVIILSYFHGAPGKDEWTKIEKIGVPINVLFIAGVLFFGDSLNFWSSQEEGEKPEETKDTFLINFSSSPNLYKWIDEYNNIDSLNKLPALRTVSHASLDEIKNHVIPFLETNFFNLDISLFYSNRYTEKLLNKLPPAVVISSDTILIKYEEKDKILNEIKQIYKKDNIYLDGIINIFICEKKPPGETRWGEIYDRVLWFMGKGVSSSINGFIDFTDDNKIDIKEEIAKTLYKMIHQTRFGDDYLGEVVEILDNNLIKIKMVNSNVYKGVKVKMERVYTIKEDSYLEERQTWLDDLNYIDDFFANNSELKKEYENISKKNKEKKDSVIHHFTEILKKDSLMIRNGYRRSFEDDNNDYYGEIISITDDEAIIRVDRFEYPFGKIKLGDETRLDDVYKDK